MRVTAKELFNAFLNLRHTGHAADQDNVIDFTSGDAGIFQRCLARGHGAFDQIANQTFKLRTRQLDVKVFRTRGVCGDERQVDIGLHRRGKLDLGFLGSFFQTLQGQTVFTQVDLLFFFELVSKVIDDLFVEVFTTKEGITVGRFNFENAIADFQNRHVKGATTKVINDHGAAVFLVQTIGQCCCGRLVDDTFDFKTRNLAGVFGCLALGVVEVCRNGNHGFGYRLTQMGFCSFLHFLKHHGCDLARGHFLAIDFNPCIAVFARYDFVRNEILVLFDFRIAVTTTDQTFNGKQGVFRVGDCLAFRRLTDKAFTIIGESDH